MEIWCWCSLGLCCCIRCRWNFIYRHDGCFQPEPMNSIRCTSYIFFFADRIEYVCWRALLAILAHMHMCVGFLPFFRITFLCLTVVLLFVDFVFSLSSSFKCLLLGVRWLMYIGGVVGVFVRLQFPNGKCTTCACLPFRLELNTGL